MSECAWYSAGITMDTHRNALQVDLSWYIGFCWIFNWWREKMRQNVFVFFPDCVDPCMDRDVCGIDWCPLRHHFGHHPPPLTRYHPRAAPRKRLLCSGLHFYGCPALRLPGTKLHSTLPIDTLACINVQRLTLRFRSTIRTQIIRI